MACRGIVGFFSNGVTKGAYHHYDAQPTDLGIEVLNYLGQVDPASLEKRAQIWMKETEPLKAGEESAKWEQLQKFLDSDDKEVPAALKPLETYVKIIQLKAETRYDGWSEQDSSLEVAKLLRQVQVEHKKKTKDQLIHELRDAETSGDDATAERLRAELLALIKETA